MSAQTARAVLALGRESRYEAAERISTEVDHLREMLFDMAGLEVIPEFRSGALVLEPVHTNRDGRGIPSFEKGRVHGAWWPYYVLRLRDGALRVHVEQPWSDEVVNFEQVRKQRRRP